MSLPNFMSTISLINFIQDLMSIGGVSLNGEEEQGIWTHSTAHGRNDSKIKINIWRVQRALLRWLLSKDRLETLLNHSLDQFDEKDTFYLPTLQESIRMAGITLSKNP